MKIFVYQQIPANPTTDYRVALCVRSGCTGRS